MRTKKNIQTFSERVYHAVRVIPQGETRTYQEIAKLAGNPRAYRAVGNILSKNPDPKHIPCHRVIRSDGTTGGYFGEKKRASEKLLKLKREGAL